MRVVVGVAALWVLAGHPVVAEPAGKAVDGTAKPGEAFYREVNNRGQEQSLWCWATAVEMISGSLGQPIEQCSAVQQRYRPRVDCCDPASWTTEQARRSCVRGGWPILKDLPGFTSTRSFCHSLWGGPASWFERRENCYLMWEELKKALQRAPVAFSWRHEDLGGQSGHMMVATGYLELPDGGRWVLVNDPWPPNAGDVMLITYERYVEGDHQHWRDYYKQAPRKAHR